MAIENGPVDDVFPIIEHGPWGFSIAMLVCRRVAIWQMYMAVFHFRKSWMAFWYAHTHVYLHYLLCFFETNKMGAVCLHRSFFMYVVHTYFFGITVHTRYPWWGTSTIPKSFSSTGNVRAWMMGTYTWSMVFQSFGIANDIVSPRKNLSIFAPIGSMECR